MIILFKLIIIIYDLEMLINVIQNLEINIQA